jgi:anti-sigma28 factor (negative regulator of flagellin synthesis)
MMDTNDRRKENSVDWKKIKAEYIAGGTSYRKLAKKYGVSFSTLRNIAIREKWTDLREQASNKSVTKLVESIGEQNGTFKVSINEVADKLLEKIIGLLDVSEFVDSQVIKQCTSALKDIKDIKGLKSEIDLREQEARIDKLRKDAMEEQKDASITVTFENEVEKYAN